MKNLKRTILSLVLFATVLGGTLTNPVLPVKPAPKQPVNPSNSGAEIKAIPGAIEIDINFK